jgi:hypothetical protein
MKSSGYSILCTGGGKVISADLKSVGLPTIFQRNAFVPLWHNAPACSTVTVKCFLVNRGVLEVSHTSYFKTLMT